MTIDPFSGVRLDSLVESARERFLLAGTGSAEQIDLVRELAGLLGDRHAARLEAGDMRGADEDAAEAVARLGQVAAALGTGHADYLDLAFMAGSVRAERWRAAGDPAVLDEAIGCLTGLEGLAPGAGPVAADLHAELALLHADRADEGGPDERRLADLDAVVAHAGVAIRELVAQDRDDQDGADTAAEVAELRARLALALVGRYRLRRPPAGPVRPGDVARARADREEAIAQCLLALPALSPGSPDWLAVAVSLGLLRYDRYDDFWPGALRRDPADLDEVIELLTPAAGEDEDVAIMLSFALGDRFHVNSDPRDLDAFIAVVRPLLESPGTDPHYAATLRVLLGAMLLERAGQAEQGSPARRDDLTAAISHLEAGITGMPPDGGELAQALALLSDACWLRLADGADGEEETGQLVRYSRRAWQSLPADDEARPLVGLHLAVGLHMRLELPDDTATVDEAIEMLRQVEPRVADRPELHMLACAELAHFLVLRATQTRSEADLAAARPWLASALAGLAAAGPGLAGPAARELAVTVATDTFELADMGGSLDDLDALIVSLNLALAGMSADPATRALFSGVLGLTYIQRAGFTQSRSDFAEGIAHLTAGYEQTPKGDATRLVFASNLGTALVLRFSRTGDLQDRDAARYYLDALSQDARSSGVLASGLGKDAVAIAIWARGQLRILDGLGDAEAAGDAVRLLRAAVAELPESHAGEGALRADLGLALLAQAGHQDGDAAVVTFEAAEQELRTALRLLPAGHVMHVLVLVRLTMAPVGTAIKARDPGRLRAAIGHMTGVLGDLGEFSGRGAVAAMIGTAWTTLHELTPDPGALDAAARWLAEAATRFDAQPGHPEHARCLMLLARVQRARSLPHRAREAGLAALRLRAGEVLLQSGTGRGLAVARVASAEATEIAAWCLAGRKPEEAVAALELGRGLVLHASTSVATVPELLTGAGHSDLAREWQAREGSVREGTAREPLARNPGPQVWQDREAPWDAGLPGAGLPGVGRHASVAVGLLTGTMPLELPSDLRARAFAALAGPVLDRLLAPPPVTQIAAALQATGADALVYLLGPAGGQPGSAVVVPAAGRPGAVAPQVIPLRMAGDDAEAMIGDYAAKMAAAAAGGRVTPGGDADEAGQRPAGSRQRAEREWKLALDQLCAWAWPAAMAPLLGEAERWATGRPPRLVLVPAGRLSLVPWHAAFRPDGGRLGRRHACEDAVFSYAASARQLVDASRRVALDPQASPVIVGNPSVDLPFAELEAQAIRDRCYPSGRYLGHATPAGGRPADGAGHPAEVLRQLPAAHVPGASVLHLACHAVAVGSAPGTSYLVLARGEALPLDAVLRRASGRPAQAPGGLVVLAACESDLALAEHDEALTLATAFLAAGAVSVAGARWEMPEGPTAALMFMFHHFLTADGLPPRDALRMAQLWMLDPRRAVPPRMPPCLAGEATRADLAEPFNWAAFTHQGR